ncbi:hypothetical protein DFQ26_005477 [Actinomortierella ambigua]|nr:hypothetical protein DFQ26_005477 [Actinomortierella ambigua]
MGKKDKAAADLAKKNCACGRHAQGDKQPCRFCPNVVCDACLSEYCCGPICEKCEDNRKELMKCDKCNDPVCGKCIVISKGAREGNTCRECQKNPARAEAMAGATEITA